MSASNCPETPRQKMIQMMYLVYTAMLALNVAAEVLNGFVTVGDAMNKSNQNIELKISDTYDIFDAAHNNNPAKTQECWEKAQQIKALSNEIRLYIDTLQFDFLAKVQPKTTVVDHTTGEKQSFVLKEGETTNYENCKKALEIGGLAILEKPEDQHEGSNYFYGTGDNPNGKGLDLQKKIIEYKRKLNDILGEDSTQLKTGLDVESDGWSTKQGRFVPWVQFNFDNTIVVSDFVILAKLKAETMNAEFDAVNLLYKKVKSNDFSFDKIAVIARPKSSYIMQGGKYELVVNVGAYDSKAHFEADVNGAHFTSNDSGAVVYTAACNATGPKNVTGTVYVKNDNGTESYPFKESYFVAEPMAVFELTEMNVVYFGIDNPIRISVPGAAAHDVVVTLADPNDATITPDKEKGAGNYIIQPKVKVKKEGIKVNASIKDGKGTRLMGSTTFRVRTIPDPKVYIGKYESGQSIPLNEFKNAKSISVRQGPDFAFKMKSPQVIKQSITITKIQGADDLESKNNNWSPDIQSYVQKAKPGCKMTIDVTVNMADGSKRTIPASFRVIR